MTDYDARINTNLAIVDNYQKQITVTELPKKEVKKEAPIEVKKEVPIEVKKEIPKQEVKKEEVKKEITITQMLQDWESAVQVYNSKFEIKAYYSAIENFTNAKIQLEEEKKKNPNDAEIGNKLTYINSTIEEIKQIRYKEKEILVFHERWRRMGKIWGRIKYNPADKHMQDNMADFLVALTLNSNTNTLAWTYAKTESMRLGTLAHALYMVKKITKWFTTEEDYKDEILKNINAKGTRIKNEQLINQIVASIKANIAYRIKAYDEALEVYKSHQSQYAEDPYLWVEKALTEEEKKEIDPAKRKEIFIKKYKETESYLINQLQ